MLLRTNGKWQLMRVADFLSEKTPVIREITKKYFTELIRREEYQRWLERDSPQLFGELMSFMAGSCIIGHDVLLICSNSEEILPGILKLDPAFPGAGE